MREFLLSQMDYIFFVCGLSFLLLGVMAYFVWRMKPRQGFWRWIVWFGFLHGLTEWMEAVGIAFPANVAFQCVRVIFLTLSFLCFVELVREAVSKKYPRLAGRWVYVPLLIAVIGGGYALNGINGISVLVRYVFGVLGGLGVVSIVLTAGRKDTVEKQFLSVFGALLALYVGMQLIVPRASFWPASAVNQDVFLAWIHVPVQFLRMVFACGLAVLLLKYYFRERHKFFLHIGHKSVSYVTGRWVVLFAALVMAGWIFTHIVTENRKVQENKNLLRVVQTIVGGIDYRHLEKLSGRAEDRDLSDYAGLKEVIDKMFEVEAQIDDVHLWGYRDGRITLLMDIERDEQHKTILEKEDPKGIYAAQRPALVNVFRNFKVHIVEPVPGQVRGVVSIFIPIIDPRTEYISGVLEISIDAHEWRLNVFQCRLFPVAITLLFVVTVLIFVFLYRREQESKQIVEENERKYFALSVELDEERDKLQTIFDASHVGLLLVDAQLMVVRINSAVAEMAGKGVDELLGNPLGGVLGCIHAQEAPGGWGHSVACAACPIRNMANRILATGESALGVQVEQMIRDNAGSVRTVWFEINATPLYINKVRHVIFVLFDITRRKEMERGIIEARDAADAANRAKSDFIANMSHEIRTPMNAILGFTELLHRTDLTPKQKAYADQITSGGKVLLSSINDILDISKISSGKVILEEADFDLYALVKDAFAMISPLISDKPIVLKYVLNELVPRRVKGDQLRLRQIILNFLGNAVKFTQKGEIALSVSLMEHADQKDMVELYFMVKDTGIGIAPEKLKDIFMPFVQEDMSITKKYGGTGLGLAICQQLVTMMGGRIGVTSQQGKGSEFTFTVALKVAGDAPQAKALVMGKQGKDDFKNMSVLVVEDSIPNQELMKAYFETLGCRVDYAANGLEAVEFLRRGGVYDLCLMDVQMPVMDGLTATKIIHDEIDKSLPVIALTAGAMPSDAAHCFQAGMMDYLSKPVDFDILKSKLLKYKERNSQIGKVSIE